MVGHCFCGNISIHDLHNESVETLIDSETCGSTISHMKYNPLTGILALARNDDSITLWQIKV